MLINLNFYMQCTIIHNLFKRPIFFIKFLLNKDLKKLPFCSQIIQLNLIITVLILGILIPNLVLKFYCKLRTK